MPILTPKERLGTQIAGKYHLSRILGKGGMGVVFGGKHSWTGREVAVKLLLPSFTEDTEIVRRFLQEAQAAAAIKHPNVVDVLDMGREEDGSVYLVLEYLHGEPLSARLKRSPLSPAEALEYFKPILGALAKAHDAGIVHRDLKPDNLYLSIAEEGGHIVPKLLDFGIAKVAGGRKTQTGMVVGTPWYMSPEQAKGQRDLTPALDVWGMAVLYFVCVSAKPPYTAKNPAEVIVDLGRRSTAIELILPSV